MEQSVPLHCPRCGAETVPRQQFCSKCGLSMEEAEAVACSLPQITVPRTPILRARAGVLEPEKIKNVLLPAQKKPLSSSKKLALISLSLLVLLSAVSFAGWQWYSNTVQPPVISRTIQAQMKYAGLTYLVGKVAQSQYFLDDPRSTRSGMVRIFLQSWNTFPFNVSVYYGDVAHLLLPGGKSLSPLTATISPLLRAGTMQRGYLDFSVPIETKSEHLTFQLGGVDEEVVLLSLNGHADLSKYASHEKPLHATLQYQGLNWTLLSVTSAWSIAGQQAKKGMRYLTFAMSVANPLSQVVIPGSPFDYMRLQAGTMQASPQMETLPVSFAAGTTASVGSVTFLVPQASKELTFILLAQSQSGFQQAAQVVLLK